MLHVLCERAFRILWLHAKPIPKQFVCLALLTGCGGTLGGESGTFTSPEYPEPYPNERECVWRIEVAPGSSIQLTITDFDVEKHTSCSYDVLEVSTGCWENGDKCKHRDQRKKRVNERKEQNRER